jgi:hypothetical protein
VQENQIIESILDTINLPKNHTRPILKESEMPAYVSQQQFQALQIQHN